MKLANHQSAQVTKMLLLGDSGSGKTGALASLADAGYNLRVIDVDNGLDVLANLLRDPKSGYSKDSLTRVDFETVTDKMAVRGQRLVPAQATVWQRAIKLLENWETASSKLGPVIGWGDKDVLVIDSLTRLSDAALNQILFLNARLGQRPHQSDWYDGQLLVEGLLQMLYDENVKCNVIVISHITYIGEEGGPTKGYPSSLGSKLPPKVGRYFNSILLAKTTGAGANQKRKIFTNTGGLVELKTTAPTRVLAEYPIESGLADYFKAVREPAVQAQATPVLIKS
jgi:AAA domain-containing protein